MNTTIQEAFEKLNFLDESDDLFEMANVAKQDTDLPYVIWIDSEGATRNVGHNYPRLKVDVDGDRIPVSIDLDPKVLVPNKTIPKFFVIKNWIVKYLDILLKHWNHEITDKEALNLLGK